MNNWKTITIWILTVLLLASSIWFVSIPKIKQLISASKISAQLSAELNTKKQYYKKLNQYAQEEEFINTQAQMWAYLIPSSQQAEILTVMLEDLGNRYSIAQSTISFEKKGGASAGIKTEENTEASSFTVSATGSYENVLAYFEGLSRLNRLVAVNNFTLTPSSENYSFNYSGSIFNISAKTPAEQITDFGFVDKLEEISNNIIKFEPLPSTSDVPLGKNNPFE